MNAKWNGPGGRTGVFARMLSGLVLALLALFVGLASPEAWAAGKQRLSVAKVYFEYNASANDLGVHVALDGEDWISLAITKPGGTPIFEVEGKGPYEGLGLTELFFEGAEPSLDDVPLSELLVLFPQGKYHFAGTTVNGDPIASTATLSHAIPAAPEVSAEVGPNHHLVISWEEVTGPPEDFPDLPVRIVAYQVIVSAFQVTVPATVLSVTVPAEFVASLSPGEQPFEVLAIEAGGNQTITEGSVRLH